MKIQQLLRRFGLKIMEFSNALGTHSCFQVTEDVSEMFCDVVDVSGRA